MCMMKQMLIIIFALLCFSCKSAKSSSEEIDVQRIDINSRYFGNNSSLLFNTNDSVYFTFDSCLISFLNNNKPYITPAEKPSIKIFGAKYSSEKHNTLMHNSNTIDSLSSFSQKSAKASKAKTPDRKSTSSVSFVVFLIVLLLFCCYKVKSVFCLCHGAKSNTTA